ncbi:hypothetical protein [Pyrodictium abyssi]|uniref:Uncharacterized protein n=1 Tax=Pyrodictium abyssi TaxID=54256 RepID=A0ABM8J133_9CREN|nr:hypothetical protein PABY_24000 [Pyrodictium abyssi]
MTRQSTLQALSLLSSVTGIVLLSLAYLSAVSGFCLRSPAVARMPPLSLLGGYGLCSYLHVEALPPLLALAGVAHAVASMELLAARFTGAPKCYRILAELTRLATWLLAGHLLALLVIAHTL